MNISHAAEVFIKDFVAAIKFRGQLQQACCLIIPTDEQRMRRGIQSVINHYNRVSEPLTSTLGGIMLEIMILSYSTVYDL